MNRLTGLIVPPSRVSVAMLLAVALCVASGHAQTTQQTSSYFYTSPSTVTVTNVFSYPGGSQLTYFYWYPDVPAGWAVTRVWADDNVPELDWARGIGWGTYTLPNPVVFYYEVSIPAGTTGDQSFSSYVWHDIGGDVTQALVDPDPLILRQPRSISGYIFHEEDNNGIYDATDQPVPDINVLLLESGTTNRLAEPAVTDANGYYSFGYLPDGDYDVAFMVKTNQVTVVPGGSDTNRNQLVPNSDRIISVSITSATNVHINVGMKGEAPLASEIHIQAYRCAEGIFIEFTTVNEVATVPGTQLEVRRKLPDGTLVLLGMAAAQGSGSNDYSLKVAEGLLDLEGPNTIRIRDEVGQGHELAGVYVSDFKASMARMTKEGMLLTWNSLPDVYYDIYRATSLNGEWELVAWEHALGSTCSTTVPVYADKPTCFFKIVMRR
jgi:hypothetical protein